MSKHPEITSDLSDMSDSVVIADIFLSDSAFAMSDTSAQADQLSLFCSIGPTGPTEVRTGIIFQKQCCPTRADVSDTENDVPARTDVFPYGTACDLGDAPRTWTGRIVSLSEWQRLSDWDRHGPNGRHWCGLCWGWHMPNECERGES